MNDLQRELERVYQLLVNIPVTGDAVEWMAAAKVGLRTAFQMARKWGGGEKGEEGDAL